MFDNKKIELAIIHTLAFFDMFDFPLTEQEIWQGLSVKCEFGEVIDVLNSIDAVENKNGWYFLRGREDIIEKRHEHYIVAQEKWRIARRATKFLKYIFGVKMVAVCNNFSYKKDSDIDLFIVTVGNRIWLTRFFVTFVVHVLGLRRYGEKVANRLCLSFYISDDGMNLEGLLLAVPTSPEWLRHNSRLRGAADSYFTYWMADLMSIYDNDCAEKLWESNCWLQEALPNASLTYVSQRIRIEDNFLSKFIKSFQGIVFSDLFEKIAKSFQKKKMSKNHDSLSKEKDSRVIISDTVLKFHEEDRREFYRNKLDEKVAEYN